MHHTHLWAQWHTRSSLVPTKWPKEFNPFLGGNLKLASYYILGSLDQGIYKKMKFWRVFHWSENMQIDILETSQKEIRKKTCLVCYCIIPKDMPSRWMTILVCVALQTFWKLNQVAGRVDRHLAHLRVWVQQTENTFAARAPGYGKFTRARMKWWLWDLWGKRINDDKW